jgi:hypothetical protein
LFMQPAKRKQKPFNKRKAKNHLTGLPRKIMPKRFSHDYLRFLRNQVPINTLIADTLGIPAKWSDGHFRFLCPLCHEFNTATNPKINLARCFRCNKNFNPIDMVMTVKRLSFIQSAQFLKPFLLAYLRTKK